MTNEVFLTKPNVDEEADKAARPSAAALPFGNGSNGVHHQFMPPIPEHLLPSLPTFPLEDGWRLVYDEETQRTYQIPLTLRDVLFPTEDDIGTVYMSQGQTHNWLISCLSEQLRLHFSDQAWYFPNDVLIRWELPGVPDKSPDIAAIPDTQVSIEGDKSFQVGIDGPLPVAIIEVTSESTRDQDFGMKQDIYAAVGIPEYLVIDLLTERSEPWRLHGFRLGNTPRYQSIPPDADGGITLQGLGLRFLPIGRTRIDVFDSTTGERLRSATEFREAAEAEAARAEAAEATIAELMERLRRLEANDE